jgi:RHS repeat-associated protein
MTKIQIPGVVDRTYTFSSTNNDGRITQMADAVSGETVQYQYDSLKRLISAATTGPQWGQSFGYDSFGNLLNQVVTKGSAPNMNGAVSGTTNRITTGGYSYDSNGNLTAAPNLTMTYDVENRLVEATHSMNGTDRYVYDPSGRRVWKNESRVYFYSVDGTLLTSGSSYNVYFAGKQIWEEGTGGGHRVYPDRLGSHVRHFPYGDEPSTTTQDRVKSATYYRDSTSTLDYARNRYCSRSIARFTTPDPYAGSASLAAPQSLNRYSYVQGDPVNANDPSGLMMLHFCTDDLCWGSGGFTWDSFGGDYHSFDFADEFNGNQYGYMQEHTTSEGLAGLGAYDQSVQNTNDAYNANMALLLGNYDIAQNIVNLNPSLSYTIVAPPTDPMSSSNPVYNAFLLASQYGQNDIDPFAPLDVKATLVGFTWNVQIRDDLLNVNKAAQDGFADPFTFAHKGSSSYYLGTPNPIGGGIGHVVNYPQGVEAHYDLFNPFNPLHILGEWLPSLVVNPSTSATPTSFTCSVLGGCYTTP